MLDREKAEHAEKVAGEDRRIAADREAVRMHLENMAGMERELQRDMDEQRAETVAIRKERVATALALRVAETDRAAAAAELAAIRERSEKLKAHTGKLAPTFRAARDFRQQIAAMKGQALSPAASTTRTTVDALARAAAAVTPPAHEARPDMIAHYAHIQRQGVALR